MINTFYGMDQLVTAPSAKTFLAAMVIGLLFGLFNTIGNRRKAAHLAGLEPVTFQTSADQKAIQEVETGQTPGAEQT